MKFVEGEWCKFKVANSISYILQFQIHPFWRDKQHTPNTLQWRHNGSDSVSNRRPHDCLRLFWRRSRKTSKLRVTGLCAGNSHGTGEFPLQMASNSENVSIRWRHHDYPCYSHFVAFCILIDIVFSSTPDEYMQRRNKTWIKHARQ